VTVCVIECRCYVLTEVVVTPMSDMYVLSYLGQIERIENGNGRNKGNR
jgi:hypothetical protein